MERKAMLQKIIKICLIILLIIILFPLWFMISGSLMGKEELLTRVSAMLFSIDESYVNWSLLPKQPGLWSYLELLLDTPEFFVTFWNSVKITVYSVIGQVVVATTAAWGLTMYSFRGQKWILSIYTILMMLPFQVLVLPEYYVLQKLHLYDTHLAIILVLIFSPLSVFLLVQNFKSLPIQQVEAARLEGAGEWAIFWKIGLPHAKPGIISVMILCFIESYSTVEHPQAFLETKQLMSLAQYLPQIDLSDAGIALAASVVALIPCILIALLGEEYFEDGIMMKEQDL